MKSVTNLLDEYMVLTLEKRPATMEFAGKVTISPGNVPVV